MTDKAPKNAPPAPRFDFAFMAALLVANIVAFTVAFQDKSWTALWVAIFGGPVMNLLFIAFGLLSAWLVERKMGRKASIELVISAPIAAGLGLSIAIFCLDLRGC